MASLHPGDLELLKLKVDSLNQVQQSQPSATVLDELTRVVLPGLNLSSLTAIAIRKNADSFEEWRRTIRKIDRDAKNDDVRTLRQRVEDELATVKRQIKRESLGSALKEYVTRAGAVAVFTSASQLALDHALTGESDPALTSGAGAIGWIGGMFLLRRGAGAGRVMVSLQRSEEMPGDITRRRGVERTQ